MYDRNFNIFEYLPWSQVKIITTYWTKNIRAVIKINHPKEKFVCINLRITPRVCNKLEFIIGIPKMKQKTTTKQTFFQKNYKTYDLKYSLKDMRNLIFKIKHAYAKIFKLLTLYAIVNYVGDFKSRTMRTEVIPDFRIFWILDLH